MIVKWCNHNRKHIEVSSKNYKWSHWTDPAIPPDPILLKAESRKDVCRAMDIALFTIANRWEQSKCPLMDE